MKRPLMVLLVLLAGPVAAQNTSTPAPGADILVRAMLEPNTDVVVGQHVTLDVDVLFRGEMPRPPRVVLPDTPGLQTIRFETQGTTMRETIAGASYVGQRFEFALYPRRGGVFEIPPVGVTLLDRQGDPAGNISGQPVRLEVTVPKGVDASRPVVATRQFTMTETWSPIPTGPFKPGDAVVRTVSRTAADLPGLAMLDLAVAAPDGVRAYGEAPDIDDHSNRGVVTGRRTDRITYVFERGGGFVLPAVTQPWWDLGAGALRSASAPAVTITVVAAPASGSASHPSWRRLMWLAGALGAFIVLLLGGRHIMTQHWPRRSTPEHEAFEALKHACESADGAVVYRALQRWAGYLTPPRADKAREASTRLRRVLFGGDPQAWTRADSARLLDRINAIRRTPPHLMAPGVLPPLNPLGERRFSPDQQ